MVGKHHVVVKTYLKSIGHKANGLGQYISVDGRPVASTKGIFRDILKDFRILFNSNLQEGQKAATNPFICLQLSCPLGAYDVNVEPTKDDLLFSDTRAILDLAKVLLERFYRTPVDGDELPHSAAYMRSMNTNKMTTSLVNSQSPLLDASPPLRNDNGDFSRDATGITSERVRQPLNLPLDSVITSDVKVTPNPNDGGNQGRRGGTNTYNFDEEDMGELLKDSDTGQPFATAIDEDVLPDNLCRNPFTMAKLNASIRKPANSNASSSTLTAKTQQAPLCQAGQAVPHRVPLGHEKIYLPSPEPISSPSPERYQNPGPPLRPWQRRHLDAEVDTTTPRSSSPSRTPPRATQSSLLDNWVQPLPPGMKLPSFQRPSILPASIRLEESAGGSSSARKPFKSPVKGTVHQMALLTPERSSPSTNDSRYGSTGPPDMSIGEISSLAHQRSSIDHAFMASQSPHPDLAQIMEFEHRKKLSIADQKRLLGSKTCVNGVAEPDPVRLGASVEEEPREDFAGRFSQEQHLHPASKSPHRNRAEAAKRALMQIHARNRSRNLDEGDKDDDGSGGADHAHPTSSMSASDCRAYFRDHRELLFAQQSSDGLSRAGLKVRRTKTSRLPFETIIEPVHNLTLSYDGVTLNTNVIDNTSREVGKIDEYIFHEKDNFVAWSAASKSIPIWEERIKSLVQGQYRSSISSLSIVPDFDIQLRVAIRNHLNELSGSS